MLVERMPRGENNGKQRPAHPYFVRQIDPIHDATQPGCGEDLTAPTSVALTCRWRSRPQHQFLTPAPQQMSFILRSDHSDHPAFLKPSICRSWSTTRIHEGRFRTKYAKFRGDTSIAIFKALLASPISPR
jgi:hypothetical protein